MSIEILNMINNNLSNDEIISKIIKYLSSEEYKKNKIKTIYDNDFLVGTNIVTGQNNVVILKDGFISKDEVIAHENNKIKWFDGYTMDDLSIYRDLLNYIRVNSDRISSKNGLTASDMKSIGGIIRNYFKLTSDSKYYDVCQYLINWYDTNKNVYKFQQDNANLFVRYELPEIISSYEASDYNGSIEEYSKLYIESNYDFKYGLKTGTDLYKTITFNEDKLFTKMSISEIKNTGAAACTEYSMMLQNCLAFLGYNVYMVGGYENNHGHNYNAIRDKNGKYRVFDIGMLVYGQELVDINSPEELTIFGERIVKNSRNSDINYSSEYSSSKHI